MINNISFSKVLINHYRIDQEYSNSYTSWKKMGSPQNPTGHQIESLEKSGQLHLYSSLEWKQITDGKIEIDMKLPRQAISLIRLTW